MSDERALLPPSFPALAALDVFTSVVELGSLGLAAERHGISQPSVSVRMRNLERQLGVELLDRHARGSTPTPEGLVVAEWADTILRAAHQLDAGLTALKAQRVGRLRIAASYTIAEYLLPGWLGRLLSEYPDDAISLDVANSTHVIERLENGDADLGFVETPLELDGMNESVVGHDDLIAVVSPRHPWAGRDDVKIDDLANTPLVMREEGSGTREAFSAALRSAGLAEPRSVLELGSTSAVRSAVMNGNSPTVVSRLAVAAELDRGQLVEVAVQGLDITRRLRAVWPEGRALPRSATTLLAELDVGSSLT